MAGIFHRLSRWLYLIWQKIRTFYLFQFKLKPKLNNMRTKITFLINQKSDRFPEGRSILVFPAQDNKHLYFLIFKDGQGLFIQEVYDDHFRQLPAAFEILPKTDLNNLLF